MRSIAIVISGLLLLVACSASPTSPPSSAPPETDPPSPPAEVDERRVGIYGALIPEVLGAERMDWRRVYVVTSLCKDPAEIAVPGPKGCNDRLSEAEQQALRDRLGLDDIRFVDDPESLFDTDWFQGPPSEVVVTLGPIVERAGDVKVGASYVCGGLCGAGNTWKLEDRDGRWVVVGTRGPGWIA